MVYTVQEERAGKFYPADRIGFTQGIIYGIQEQQVCFKGRKR